MTDTDLLELAGDAVARIEEARTSGKERVRAAQQEGRRILRLAADCAIGSDSDLPFYARDQANSLLAQALAYELTLYFNVLTYECFVVTPVISEFETRLEKLDVIATREFPGAPIDLDVAKRAWMSRALGRATLQGAAGGQVNVTFWHDLQMQFQDLGCPHLYAVPGNGWWHIDGLPKEPFEQDTLKSRLIFAIRQAVAGLGLADVAIALPVWLDLLRNCSPHYMNRRITNLSAASAEFCADRATRSVAAYPAEMGVPGPSRTGKLKPGPKKATEVAKKVVAIVVRVAGSEPWISKEEAAVREVMQYYRKELLYEVKDRQDEHCGWDLEATKDDVVLHLEVKGVAGKEVAVELSANEYKWMKKNEKSYRVCIVTNALSKTPMLSIYGYVAESKQWEHHEDGSPIQIEPVWVQTARLHV